MTTGARRHPLGPLFAAVLSLLLGSGQAGARESGEKTLSELEADLASAVAAGSVEGAAAPLRALAAMDEPKAADAIISQALRGTNYPIEMQAAGLLLKAKDPRVRGRIIEGVKGHPNYKTRIVLLAVVARMIDDPKALAALHGALKDPSKPVVLGAIQWIRNLKREESVEPLIDALAARDGRPLDRIYFDLRKALEEITGHDLETGADWRPFWEAKKKGLSAPAKSKETRTIAYRASFFSVAVDSDRVLFVIDVSGSMTEKDWPLAASSQEDGAQGATGVGKAPEPTKPEKDSLPSSRQRIYRVKEELVRVVRGLPSHVQFGILAFSHELKYNWPSRALKPATDEAKKAAVSWVQALRAEGATRTDLALREAFETPEVDTIIVLTDGAPKNEKDRPLPIDPILAEAKTANRFLKARIHTVSFVQIKDKSMRRFVRELSVQNDGGEPHLLP
jgi:hypothetical protein